MPSPFPDLKKYADVLEILVENADSNNIIHLSEKDIAKLANCSDGFVSEVVKENGYSFPPERRSQTKNASVARRKYCRAKRLEVLDEAMEKAQDILKITKSGQGLRDWAIAWGTLTDKYMLEEKAEKDAVSSERYGLSKAIQKMEERRNAR